jgi:ubiquinone biosynthesis protein Coq4
MKMEELLLSKGFKKVKDSNEYVKKNWTIRPEGDMIEVFNLPNRSLGKYYYGNINNIDVEFLLDTIEDMC